MNPGQLRKRCVVMLYTWKERLEYLNTPRTKERSETQYNCDPTMLHIGFEIYNIEYYTGPDFPRNINYL